MNVPRWFAPLALLAAPLVALPGREASQDGQDGQEQGQEKDKEKRNAVTAFFEGEAERLTRELEGSWMLLEYVDPDEVPLEDAANGFMTFHDGFVTWTLAVEALEQRWFTVSDRIFLQTGAYRYRIDERASLQLASVLTYSNDNGDGVLQRDGSLAFEYLITLQDDVLELSDSDGVRMTYRRIQAGEFPENAVRKIEQQRSRTPAWEDEER